jgi:uncharacterized protein
MSDTPRLFPLSDQPASVQLIVSAIVILFTGMIFLFLFIIGGSLFFGMGISEILSIGEGRMGNNSQLLFKYLQGIQEISLFIIPSFIISYLMTNSMGNWLLTRNTPSGKILLMVICLAFLMIPVTSVTGLMNSRMVLPGWLNGLETWMKDKEDTAAYLTGILVEAKNIQIFIINMIVLAVIPAVGEELLFRGVIQQIFQKMFKSGHLAIWITALIFSSIHLQFYGFLPRLLLGLVFGYLFYWGRSMWLPVTAHFVNNAIPVISSYLVGWDQTNNKTFELAETRTWFIILSVTGCIIILSYFRYNYTKRNIESVSVNDVKG